MATSKESSFKILTDREHIIMRPQMYIGSTSPEEITQLLHFKKQTLNIVPGLLKIINEIIDNSVDEAIRTNFQFANKISIDITPDRVTVSDNGRGIPVKDYDGIYQAELAWTRAKAGTSFSDDRNTIGANGVGSFATNCFSVEFNGESCDGSRKVSVTCVDNCDPEKITTKLSKSSKNGTTVSFKPDLQKFHLTEITEDHIEYIKDRIYNIQICYPEIQFIFNGDKIKIGSINDIAKQFSEHALALSINDHVKVVIAPSGDSAEFSFISYLNGLNLKNGGTHIDMIMSKICDELRAPIKKKWKIDVVPNQIKQHLVLGCWASNFVNPKFDSQSKERLTNTTSEINSFFGEIDYQKIAKKIIATEQLIMPMIESILYKKELAEKRAAKAALKNSAKIKSDKHIAATSKKSEEKSLTLAEGLSAISGFLTARNPLIHGSYALRGKVLNINGLKKDQIALNQELAELMGIIGLNLYDSAINEDPTNLYQIDFESKKYIVGINDVLISSDGTEVQAKQLCSIPGSTRLDPTDSLLKTYKNQTGIIRQTGESILNYGTIRIMTDMDPDGSDIQCLLIQFFALWPDLFAQRRITRLMTPLFVARKEKCKTHYLYSFEEYDQQKNSLKGYQFDYIKGLGSLSAEDYKETVITNPRDVIITLDPEYRTSLEKAFGDSAQLRKDWLIG